MSTCEHCGRVLDQNGDCPLSEWGRASREAQGLPPTIQDPATLRKIGTIIARGLREDLAS